MGKTALLSIGPWDWMHFISTTSVGDVLSNFKIKTLDRGLKIYMIMKGEG